MGLQSKTLIYIGGNEIDSFLKFSLDQSIAKHHCLELVCRMDVLDNITQGIASESKNFLGEIITLQVEAIKDYENHEKLEFKGVVTAVDNTKRYADKKGGDLVIIKAHSCDIITDDGAHYASHNDVGLSAIMEDTLRGYDRSKLETVISPRYSESLHYSVQNGESAYQYIRRLAAQYGEWFYYNGKKLIFGAPEEGETVTLSYGQDLKRFSLNLIPGSNNYKYFTNDYIADQQQEKSTSQINSGANGYTHFTNQKSEALYNKETRVFTNIYNDPQLKRRLDAHVEQQKKATEIKQVLFKGRSNNPGVQVGKIVRVEGDNVQCGNYRITKVKHINEDNNYYNTFEGVTAEMDVYPNTDIMAYPKSGSQVGVVTDTADPEGMSRIRVQFLWQVADGEKTPWIRVLTPHAGAGKGLQFTPEIGEEVLVGFEGDNAERPYVMGALYTGSSNASDWKSDTNDIKAISSKSGHNITLNDKQGEESITITDRNGNSITLDTVTSEITISAPKKITLSSEEIEINASKKVVVEGTNNVEIKSQEILADGTSKTTVKSTSQVNVEAANTNVKGTTQLKLEGATTDIDGTAMTNVKGGMLNLNCS